MLSKTTPTVIIDPVNWKRKTGPHHLYIARKALFNQSLQMLVCYDWINESLHEI